MSSQPQPVRGGADAHREQEQDDEDDPLGPAPSLEPEDRGDGGGGGGGRPPSDTGGTSTFGAVPAKKIAMVAVGLIALYAAWKLMRNRNVVDVKHDRGPQRQSEPDDIPHRPEEVPEDIPVDEQGNPIIRRNGDDPLQADDQAGRIIFGWGRDQ